MNKISTKKIVLNGLMIALVFLTTYFTHIPGPIPPGYINFGDIVIMVAAILMGKNSGFVVGAFGSALADVASSAFIFAPATFIIKGLEGFVVGAIVYRGEEEKPGELLRIIAVITGAAVMVIGYFFTELYVLKFFDPTFGYTAAIAELPLNMVQGGVSAAVGYILSILLIRSNVRKYILN